MAAVPRESFIAVQVTDVMSGQSGGKLVKVG